MSATLELIFEEITILQSQLEALEADSKDYEIISKKLSELKSKYSDITLLSESKKNVLKG
jgi:prefoldin subunit 5